MFENVDGRTDDGRRTTDARVTGILIAHLRAFGSGELTSTKKANEFKKGQQHSTEFLAFKFEN